MQRSDAVLSTDTFMFDKFTSTNNFNVCDAQTATTHCLTLSLLGFCPKKPQLNPFQLFKP